MVAQLFVLELGRALHALGSASYRIEDAMAACAQRFGLAGAFFVTPTSLFSSLGPVNGEPQMRMQRVEPGGQDLGKLAQLYAVRDEVMSGRIGPELGLQKIGAVMEAEPTSGPLALWLAHGCACAAACVFLKGGVAEVAAAGITGLVVGALGLLARLRPSLDRAFEPLACLVAALLIHALAVITPFNTSVATIGSVIVLLPGLAFTTAFAELTMRHLASGSARLMGAVAVLLTMAVGVGIGSRLGTLLFGAATAIEPVTLPPLFQIPAVAVAGLAFGVLLRASRSQLPYVLLAAVIGMAGWHLGARFLDAQLGAFVGSGCVAAAANLYARWTRRPAAVVRTPGLLLLVPGSFGFRWLTQLLDQKDLVEAMQPAFQMLVIAGALVAGMLFAGLLVPPPRDIEPGTAW